MFFRSKSFARHADALPFEHSTRRSLVATGKKFAQRVPLRPSPSRFERELQVLTRVTWPTVFAMELWDSADFAWSIFASFPRQ